MLRRSLDQQVLNPQDKKRDARCELLELPSPVRSPQDQNRDGRDGDTEPAARESKLLELRSPTDKNSHMEQWRLPYYELMELGSPFKEQSSTEEFTRQDVLVGCNAIGVGDGDSFDALSRINVGDGHSLEQNGDSFIVGRFTHGCGNIASLCHRRCMLWSPWRNQNRSGQNEATELYMSVLYNH